MGRVGFGIRVVGVDLNSLTLGAFLVKVALLKKLLKKGLENEKS